MATAPSPNDLTRQQLDELDALLQRMLALPVNPDDEIVRDVPAPRGGTDQPDVPWPTNTYPAAYMVVQTSGPQDLPPAEPDPPSPEPDLGPDVIPAGQGEEGGTADPLGGPEWPRTDRVRTAFPLLLRPFRSGRAGSTAWPGAHHPG